MQLIYSNSKILYFYLINTIIFEDLFINFRVLRWQQERVVFAFSTHTQINSINAISLHNTTQ